MDPERASPTLPVSPPDADSAAMTWRFRRDFGVWLRDLRHGLGLTLREAATPLAISYTKLHKLEVGARARPPSLELIGRLATLYGKELDVMLARAGYKMAVPADLRDAVVCDDAFASLMLHPALRPVSMDERWLEAYSRVQKAQILDFARKLDALVRGGGPSVADLIREARDDDRPEAR